MKNILFMGPLYPTDRENEINENSIIKPSNAPNVFQWNLISGLLQIIEEPLRVINVLPVGTWKNTYRKLILRDSDWHQDGINGHEIGCVNLPFVKQWIRSKKARKLLKKRANETTEIIIYSAYMPFLRAVYPLPKSVKVTAIITDLPEYYDLANTSKLKKSLRKNQNRMVYKYLNRIDRFVILTDQMYGPLRIGNRPYVRVEGICNFEPQKTAPSNVDKKAILYSGTLHYQYGIRNLLTAFESIENRNIELWICGSGEAEKEIKDLAQKDDRVKFFGFCTKDEVVQIRSRASILVNPRTNDGEYTKYSFPSKTMEYMVSGKPIVMYKLDGIPDEYDEYLNYACVSSPEYAGLRDAIVSTISNYNQSLLKAKKAREFVLKNKNSKIQAEKILRMIRDD